MTVYLDTENRFHRDGAAQSLECPHCGILSHMRIGSTPDFGQMQIQQPAFIGIALQCDACKMPVFVRYRIRDYGLDRIEFFPGGQQIEKPPESFSYGYLPSVVADTFKEALGCYSSDLPYAFATMCRRTALVTFDSLGERGKLKCYEQVQEIQQLAGIEPRDFEIVRKIIFEMDLDDGAAVPTLSHMQTIILLETMKDMLHQAFVRGGKLQKALQLRRYFAEQARPPDTRAKDHGADRSRADDRAEQESIIMRVLDRANRS